MDDISYCFNAKTAQGTLSFWLPLPIHHSDTAGVARKLAEEWLPHSMPDACRMEEDAFRCTLIFLAMVHDIGKMTAAFQFRISRCDPAQRELLAEGGFPLPPESRLTLNGFNHAAAGEAILLRLGCGKTAASVIGAHHGTPSSINSGMEGEPDTHAANFGHKAYPRLEEAWRETFSAALEQAGWQSAEQIPTLTPQAEMLLSGILILADWIASNQDFFPLIGRDTFTADAETRLEAGWEAARRRLTPPWEPHTFHMNAALFRDRFGFSPNTLQKAVCGLFSEGEEPGLLIVEAPMGCGKTEAALAAAELMASSNGAGGLFFGLPTQATSNGMFSRLIGWAERQAEDGGALSISLVHSRADFNDEFTALFDSDSEGVGEDGGLVVNQ